MTNSASSAARSHRSQSHDRLSVSSSLRVGRRSNGASRSIGGGGSRGGGGGDDSHSRGDGSRSGGGGSSGARYAGRRSKRGCQNPWAGGVRGCKVAADGRPPEKRAQKGDSSISGPSLGSRNATSTASRRVLGEPVASSAERFRAAAGCWMASKHLTNVAALLRPLMRATPTTRPPPLNPHGRSTHPPTTTAPPPPHVPTRHLTPALDDLAAATPTSALALHPPHESIRRPVAVSDDSVAAAPNSAPALHPPQESIRRPTPSFVYSPALAEAESGQPTLGPLDAALAAAVSLSGVPCIPPPAAPVFLADTSPTPIHEALAKYGRGWVLMDDAIPQTKVAVVRRSARRARSSKVRPFLNFQTVEEMTALQDKADLGRRQLAVDGDEVLQKKTWGFGDARARDRRRF